MDPLTIALISSAVGAGAQQGGSFFARRKAKKAQEREEKKAGKQAKRELKSEAEQRQVDILGDHINSRAKKNKLKGNAMLNSADLIREAMKL